MCFCWLWMNLRVVSHRYWFWRTSILAVKRKSTEHSLKSCTACLGGKRIFSSFSWYQTRIWHPKSALLTMDSECDVCRMRTRGRLHHQIGTTWAGSGSSSLLPSSTLIRMFSLRPQKIQNYLSLSCKEWRPCKRFWKRNIWCDRRRLLGFRLRKSISLIYKDILSVFKRTKAVHILYR